MTELTKDVMLDSIDKRISELYAIYKSLCLNKNEHGVELTRGTAAVRRAQTKRDIQELMLLKQVLMGTSDTFAIPNGAVDCIEGWNKLVSPREHRGKR